MPHPDKKTLNAFRFTFFHGRPGDSMSFPTLGGSSKWVYDDANDLVATKNPAEQDRLSMFIQDNFAFLFKVCYFPFFKYKWSRVHADRCKLKEYRPSKDNLPTHSDSVRYISGRRISVFASYISTVLVSMLLIGAVVILYLVPSSNVRLGLISLFTVLFANSVALLTNARRTEVFGVTAAYVDLDCLCNCDCRKLLTLLQVCSSPRRVRQWQFR